MPSENEKVEKIHNTNTEQELKNRAILKVNEISVDLYCFKVKSREIQLRIQNDINTFKLNADLIRLDELRLKKDDSLAIVLNSLNELNLELKEVAALIVEMRKLSNPEESSANREFKTEEINKKLQAFTKVLYYKTARVKWCYELLKPQIETESSQRELIASLLLKYLQKETLAQPASALKHESDSLPRPTQWLSDLTLQMNKMISKLSLNTPDKVPAKSSIFDEQQPIFEAGPTSFQSQTEPPSTGLSSNSKADIFGAKQMTSNNLSSTNVPGATKASAPPLYGKFELPSSKTFEFKLPGNHNKTSTLQANDLPSEPQLNNIGAKSASNVPEATKASAPPLYGKFELPSSKTFEFKLPGNPNKTSTLQANDLPSEPQLNNIGAKSASSQDVPEATKASAPPLYGKFELPSSRTFEFKLPSNHNKTSTLQVDDLPSEPQLNNVGAKSTSSGNCDLSASRQTSQESYFKFTPPTVRLFEFNQETIKSSNTKLDLTAVEPMILANDTGLDWTSDETKQADILQSITVMDEFKNRSFEEWRLGDYIIARKFHPKTFGGCTKALDAVHVKFHPTNDINLVVNANQADKFQCITVMDEFKNKSFEELRLLDYVIARVVPPETFSTSAMGTARVKFVPPVDVFYKVQYQYITSIKEFENKSIEELRLEDYLAGRKGPTQDVFKHKNFQNSHSEFLRSTPNQNGEAKTNGEIPTLDGSSYKLPLRRAVRRGGTPNPKQETSTTTEQERKTSTENHATPVGVTDENAAAVERLIETNKNEEAIKMSTDTLKLDPENVHFLVIRARAYYELKMYREGLEDAQKALGISPTLSENGYICIAKCCLALGKIALGQQTVRNAMGLYASSFKVKDLCVAFRRLVILQERTHRFMSERKYYNAVRIIDRCLELYCTACFEMKLLKAECLAHMNKIQQARCIAIDTSLLCTNAGARAVYADAIYVVGLCSYYEENDELAIKHFRKVLEHDPDHEKAIKMIKLTKTRKNTKLIIQKKEKGNEAFNAGEYMKALKFYNEALSVDKNNKQENAKLHYNRATVFAKQNQLSNAIDACTAALQLDENYVKPLLRRAQCYTEIKMYDKALEDYEKLYCIDSTDEYKLLLQEANERQMANKGPYYYYKILGISETATMDQIKTAYKKCAMRYHPDRHVGASLGELRTNERKFKQAKEAYDTLGETRSRANYDRTQTRYDTKYSN